MTGVDWIRAERARQIEVLGYSTQHDADHGPEQLLQAAVAYLLGSEPYSLITGRRKATPGTLTWYPWDPETLHLTPANRPRELAKAGALIAAAIDLLLAEIAADEGH